MASNSWTWIFQGRLAAHRGFTPAERRAWRDSVFAHIQVVTRLQGEMPGAGLPVERMCTLAGVSRAAYYRAWGRSDPLREETALRGVVQRLALANRHYGYRRIGALLRREGWCVNHKRVVRNPGLLRSSPGLRCSRAVRDLLSHPRGSVQSSSSTRSPKPERRYRTPRSASAGMPI